MTQENIARDLGPQPLGEILKNLDLSNSDLVAASTDQLTHKQVQKAIKGRRLSKNIQTKIVNALRTAKPDTRYGRIDLFNY